MIERVNQTIVVKYDLSGPLNLVLWSASYNFPRANQLQLSFRVKPAEGIAETGSVVQGLQLKYGIGSPPDFGLGSTQTELVPLPPQTSTLSVYDRQSRSLKDEIETAKSNEFWIKEQLPKTEVESIEERALRQQLNAAENEKKQLEGELAALEAQKPSGWTPLVETTIARSFDALQLSLLAAEAEKANANEFPFEFTATVSRPEDTGPTYTQPFATAGGG